MLGSETALCPEAGALCPNAGQSQSKTRPSHVRFIYFGVIYWLAFAMSLRAASAQDSKESESTTPKLTTQEVQ